MINFIISKIDLFFNTIYFIVNFLFILSAFFNVLSNIILKFDLLCINMNIVTVNKEKLNKKKIKKKDIMLLNYYNKGKKCKTIVI